MAPPPARGKLSPRVPATAGFSPNFAFSSTYQRCPERHEDCLSAAARHNGTSSTGAQMETGACYRSAGGAGAPPGCCPARPEFPPNRVTRSFFGVMDSARPIPRSAPGTLPPANQLCSVVSPVSVTIGNVAATVIGAALAPGSAGLYQIAIQVPPSAQDGDQPVIAQVAGMQSALNVLLSVKR
uniref:Uncharacterized protein n=1 Tax=Solibacter usitatus (strain Ellin6076) TaxID=234267 RepID=Q02C86_SOLUE